MVAVRLMIIALLPMKLITSHIGVMASLVGWLPLFGLTHKDIQSFQVSL
jgi:hypothetical protein